MTRPSMLRLALAGPSKTAVTPVCRRCFSSSETLQAPPEAGRRQGGGRRRPRGMLPPFHTWITSRDADVYRHPAPGTGPNWIGETPFPLNPSFNPPSPITNRLRDLMWKLHSEDPRENSVRSLSGRFSIGLDRTVAILRLKALEKEMAAEGKPVQSEFQKNMDRLLGATSKNSPETKNVAEFEPTEEVQSSAPRPTIMEDMSDSRAPPGILRPALEHAGRRSSARRKSLPTGGPDPKAQVSAAQIKTRSARPAIKIVDVRGISYAGAGSIERKRKLQGTTKPRRKANPDIAFTPGQVASREKRRMKQATVKQRKLEKRLAHLQV